MSELDSTTLLDLLARNVGDDEPISNVEQTLDIAFGLLGFDSLTVLKTIGRIEREYRITLPDNVLSTLRTPRQLLAKVNEELSAPTGT